VLDEARDRYPDNPVVEFATASHELTTGRPAQAADRFGALVDLRAEVVIETGAAYDGRLFGEWSWNGLGLARFALGDDAAAAAAFARAEELAPANPAYRARRVLAEARAQGA
jgi:hypothetical protein